MQFSSIFQYRLRNFTLLTSWKQSIIHKNWNSSPIFQSKRWINSTKPFHIGHPNVMIRQFSKQAYQQHLKEKNRRAVIYISCVIIGAVGVTYASVPLYKIFCQTTGFGGTTQRADIQNLDKFQPRESSTPIRIYFTSNVSDEMPWSFQPQQKEVVLVPGETALAFYTAKNPTDKSITGVATYNVYPPKAGLYFNKIQCFCFEEQRLRPKEEVDMPVFFFIDPEILDDPTMENVHNITLSYTFFKTDDIDENEVE